MVNYNVIKAQENFINTITQRNENNLLKWLKKVPIIVIFFLIQLPLTLIIYSFIAVYFVFKKTI